MGHNHIDHNYIGHNYIVHNYIGVLMSGDASSFDYKECKEHLFKEPTDPICKFVLG